MSRATLILNSPAIRAKAANWALKVPDGTRVEFKQVKRSLPQNSRFWAMLTDVATQVRWHDMKLSADDWKLIFMASLKKEMRIVPNLDGTGFVNLGASSSDLSVAEMGDLMTLIEMFGAQHGVRFYDEKAA